MVNSQLSKHLKRTFWIKYRNWKHKRILGQCGDNVYIEPEVHIMRYPKKVQLGDNMVLKSGARICPCNENASISIGSSTTIGYHTYIFASKHNHQSPQH